MDAAERQLLDETVRDAVTDAVVSGADAAAVDKVLTDLGWLEMLEAEPRDATAIVFTALGLANGAASALDDVVTTALGVAPRPDLAVVLPAYGSWDAPGRVEDGTVRATGLTGPRVTSASEVLVVCTVGSDLPQGSFRTPSAPRSLPRGRASLLSTVTVPSTAVDATPAYGADPEGGLHTVRVEHDVTNPVTLAPDAWTDAVAAGRRAVAHQIAGASRSALDLARTHALEREQFGRSIGKFQAVRHRLAETLVAIEALDATLGAAWDEPGPMTAALASAQAGRTARIVAAHCQQVLAGIGFTTDHPFHRYLKRTMALEGLFGTTDEIVVDLGRQLLDSRKVPRLIELSTGDSEHRKSNTQGDDMQEMLSGIRVVEVAAWTFVPISGAVLAEWGADVIKVEHPQTGDPQRGLVSSGLVPGGDGVNFMFEIPNRGKRSVALDISTDAGRELLYKIVETADVFVTNHLPDVRRRLGIDVDAIRARNPNVIYVRGSGMGQRGPDKDKGGFDGATFWGRAGLAMAFKDPSAEWPVDQRPAFGDVMGGLTIAGGIAAALVRRERTGVPSIVDVSLLGMGAYALAPDITSAKLYEGVEIPSFDRDSMPNPLVGTYPTKDGRFIILLLLQADRFWPDLAEHLDRPDLVEDPRFKDGMARYEHRAECIQVLREIFRSRTYTEWCDRLQTLKGVWAPLQTPLEMHDDPQVLANGYLEQITVASGAEFALPANPVQFDETPPQVGPAPDHGEHTDEVLLELGLSYDEIIEHKISGAVL